MSDHTIEIFEDLAKIKTQLSGFEITKQPKLMQHFTCHFKPLPTTHDIN